MRVALATGAGHRLGRELALGLGRAGYTVAVHYRSRREEAAETLRLLRAAGADGNLFPADLAEPDAPGHLVGEVLARFGRLDALLHAASPWVEKAFADMLLADWDEALHVGPRAAFFLAQAAAPALTRSGGAILLVSDVAATQAWPRHIPHSVAKAAMNALVTNLARALAPAVRVNAVAPGIVLPPADLPPEVESALVEKTLLRRRVAVEDLVAAAILLLTNGSITGQVLAVDAGRVIA